MISFKNKHRDMQEIIKEILALQNFFSPFAECSLLLLALERFLRIVPDIRANNNDTLSNLLDKVLSPKKQLFSLPKEININDFKKLIREFRNGLMHGDFEGLAKRKKCSSTEEYFKKFFFDDKYIIWLTLNSFVLQIDKDTGKKNLFGTI